MVKAPYIDKNGLKKGAWGEDEDEKLRAYVHRYGHWNWRLLPKFAGLQRCGKSCRLRWMNYLKPGVKRGEFSQEERDLIAKLHQELGNKWSAIAAKLPGRTDNDVKNYWQTLIQRSEKRSNTKSGSHAEISKEKMQPSKARKYYVEDLSAASEVTSCVNSRSRRREKSEASCDDIFILESSSSNSVACNAAFGWDLNLSVEQNGFEIL